MKFPKRIKRFWQRHNTAMALALIFGIPAVLLAIIVLSPTDAYVQGLKDSMGTNVKPKRNPQ